MKAVNWERKPLGAVAYLCLGKMLDQNKNRGEPLPYLANVNVRWGEFELSDLRTMRFEPKEMDRYGLKFGDIVMCEGGEPGRCAIWKDQIPGMMIQKAIHRIRPKEFLDYRFLFYSFLHLGNSKVFDQYFTGATIKHLPGEKLAKVEVDIPPLPVQQRIAGILSAYDELIENSQRRIKILESMARALYREWFVHFRFPDHEHHQRVASPLGEIPRGWEVKKLGEIISAHIGGGWGKDAPDEEHTEPAWVIRGTDIPEARHSQVGGVPHRIHTASNLRSRRLVAGDIVFEVSGGSKGQPVGRSLLITSELLAGLGGDVICASFCKRIQPDISGYGSELLYLSFLEGYESGEIEQYQVQSTGISNFKWTEYIANTDRVVPPDALRSEFRGHVAPLFTQVATLGRKIQNLRRTRDLLLPRLLSGQIDVSNLPEPVPA